MKKYWIAFLMLSVPCFGLRADINGDGRVDMADLAILASEWMMEEPMSYPDKIQVTGTLTIEHPTEGTLTLVTPLILPYRNDDFQNPGYYYWATDEHQQSSDWLKSDLTVVELIGTVIIKDGDYWVFQATSGPTTYVWTGPAIAGGTVLGDYIADTPTHEGTATVTARTPLHSGTIVAPGRAHRIRSRARGVYMAVRLSNIANDETFGMERIVCNVEPCGRVK